MKHTNDSTLGPASDPSEFVGCPDCGAPAEIVDRFVLDSTDGPLEHLKLWCVTGRWFTVLTENLPATARAPREEVEQWRAG